VSPYFQARPGCGLVGAKHGKGFATCPDQAMKFAESLVRGEPNRAKIALTALSDKVRELV